MDELRELYQEVILDHGRSPRNLGRPEGANREAHGDNPLCGDRIDVFLTVTDGVVTDVGFEGRGCAISTASASMMTEMLRGRTVDEVRALFDSFHAMVAGDDGATDTAGVDLDKLMVLSGVRQYPMRVKCATLAWHTMKAALSGSDSETISTEA